MGKRRKQLDKLVDRGTKYTLLAVFAVGIRHRNPGAVTNALVSYIGTYLPLATERVLGVQFRPWQRFYVDVAMVTHAIGMLGPYDDVWWWDHLTHVLSSSILGGLAFVRARHSGRNPTRDVVTIVLGGGLLWEVLEYGIHATANWIGLEPVLVFYSKTDTILDLASNLTGALLVIAFGDRVLENLTPFGDQSHSELPLAHSKSRRSRNP